MENDKKKCYSCKNLDRYYTKENTRYSKTCLGWCIVKKQIVDVKGVCESFKFKSNERRIRFGIQRYLSDLLLQISTIRQIIEDETNETSEE